MLLQCTQHGVAPTRIVRSVTIAVGMVGVLCAITARAGDAGRLDRDWHRVRLGTGQELVVRVMGQSERAYSCFYQGANLQIGLDRVASVETLDEYRRRSGDRYGISAKQESRFRDAIEELVSLDKDVSVRAYRVLRKSFSAARVLIEESLKHGNARVRKLALKLIRERGAGLTTTDAIVPLLFDSSPLTRLEALRTLRVLGKPAVKDLLQYLEWESRRANRKSALRLIESWKDPRFVQPLIDLLATEEDKSVKKSIVSALNTLTGQSLGDDVTAWRRYMSRVRAIDNLRAIQALEDK